MKKNIPFRVAHDIAGKMVADCIKKNCQLEGLTLIEMQQFSDQIDESIYDAINLSKMVIAHDTSDHTQESTIDTEISLYQQKEINTTQWIEEKQQRLQAVSLQFELQNRKL